jgi:hypothetical protein
MLRFSGFKRTIITGLIASCASVGTTNAGPPPLDRPSPPPYCADGICHPNPLTFGWYPTRWRRWPTVALEPTPAKAVPPGGRVPDVRPYELPPKEEEDRAAPPHTQPRRDEGEEDEETEGTGTPGAMPVVPPGRGLDLPLPSDEGGPAAPSGLLPWETDEPATRPTTSPLNPSSPLNRSGTPSPLRPSTSPLNNGTNNAMPSRDDDRPPAPPFRSPAAAKGPVVRALERSTVRPAQYRVSTASGPADRDPPPSLPMTLADGRQ